MFLLHILIDLMHVMFVSFRFQRSINLGPHYDLQSVLKDHNGNKRNHFVFFVLSLVFIGKPWYIQM